MKRIFMHPKLSLSRMFNRRSVFLYLFYLLLLCPSVVSVAQISRQRFYTAQGVWGSVFAHTKDVENTNGAQPYGLQIESSRRILKHPHWNACNCFPYTGMGMSVYDFDNRILGRGANLYMFLEPVLNPFNRFQFSIKGAVGFAYLSNPYDAEENPTNFSYSLPVNGYLMLGVNAAYPLNPKWALQLSGVYQHVSNGGFREPNKGINWPSLQFGLRYSPQERIDPVRYDDTVRYRNSPIELWATGFGSSRTINELNNVRYVIAGIEVSAWKRVGASSKLGVALEGIQDYSVVPEMDEEGFNPEQYSPFRLGFSAGHGYLMGRFVFTQQIGVYLYKDLPYFKRIYQRWGLDYRFNSRLSAGVNLLSHLQVANFIDIHLRYRLR